MKKRVSPCGIALLLLFSFLSATTPIHAQEEALWLRRPCISPDGSQIAFGYKGNLYKVSASGGQATALTVGSTYVSHPVWSRDGKQIAFADDRNGNFEVYLMPATGGNATRLTYNSGNDFPFDFSPDHQSVLFGSDSPQPAASIRFPCTRLFQNLYTVSTTGGRAQLISAAAVDEAHFSRDGQKIIFQESKGCEDSQRKHQTSSITTDLRLFDRTTQKYHALTQDEIDPREPVFSADQRHFFYLSQKDGTFNIYKKAFELQATALQLTHFKDYPVRNLSITQNNSLSFTQNGALYVLPENGEATKISVFVNTENGELE